MEFKPVILWTDALVFILLFAVIIFAWWTRKHEYLKAPWRQVIKKPLGAVTLVILLSYMGIGLLDSFHFQILLPQTGAQTDSQYSTKIYSLLDFVLKPIGAQEEKTYSAPLALHLYSKEAALLPDGQQIRAYPTLEYAGKNVTADFSYHEDLVFLILEGVGKALLYWLLLSIAILLYQSRQHRNENIQPFKVRLKQELMLIIQGQTLIPWRAILFTLGIILLLGCIATALGTQYHLLGTDKIGQDVFYLALKGVRTSLIIGTLTTLVMLPFAVLLGTSAGYFGGIIDDIIQYIYTTLNSIPGVLLIAAAVLSLQIFVTNHPDFFSSLAYRADARLLGLCVILGVTSWTSLCRMLRGESLKLREIDYIQAAHALGVGHFKTIIRHILPNVMHIVLIAVVLDFSGLVLAEAVLTYVGVGVDPTTISWGNMINAARLELAREPVVWWPLATAFVFMFILVMAANLFSDVVRDAFDPRIRK